MSKKEQKLKKNLYKALTEYFIHNPKNSLPSSVIIPGLSEPPVRTLRVLPQLSVFCFQWVYFCDKILVSIKGGK